MCMCEPFPKGPQHNGSFQGSTLHGARLMSDIDPHRSRRVPKTSLLVWEREETFLQKLRQRSPGPSHTPYLLIECVLKVTPSPAAAHPYLAHSNLGPRSAYLREVATVEAVELF